MTAEVGQSCTVKQVTAARVRLCSWQKKPSDVARSASRTVPEFSSVIDSGLVAIALFLQPAPIFLTNLYQTFVHAR